MSPDGRSRPVAGVDHQRCHCPAAVFSACAVDRTAFRQRRAGGRRQLSALLWLHGAVTAAMVRILPVQRLYAQLRRHAPAHDGEHFLQCRRHFRKFAVHTAPANGRERGRPVVSAERRQRRCGCTGPCPAAELLRPPKLPVRPDNAGGYGTSLPHQHARRTGKSAVQRYQTGAAGISGWDGGGGDLCQSGI